MITLADLPHEFSETARRWDLSSLVWDGSSQVTLRENIPHAPRTASATSKPTSRFISRSYSGAFVAEVQSQQYCGIDIELAAPSNGNWSIRSKHFVDAVLAPNELPLLLETSWAKEPFFETQIWASKEAFAKASGDASQYEPNELTSPMTWSDSPHAERRAINLNFQTDAGECLIMWVVTLKPQPLN